MAKSKIIKGSGNVFADLGLPNPEQCLEKAKLVSEIREIIKVKKLTQAKVAKILGVDQPRVSDLMSGHFYRFSLSKLVAFLEALGKRVIVSFEDIKDKPTRTSSSSHSPSRRIAARCA